MAWSISSLTSLLSFFSQFSIFMQIDYSSWTSTLHFVTVENEISAHTTKASLTSQSARLPEAAEKPKKNLRKDLVAENNSEGKRDNGYGPYEKNGPRNFAVSS
ncbi:predicted protein [Histoplasma capsulatum H143]|uniref:Uncharacterized protein n=1 Tax=Ajellomyces capsulatus (strain H143) TaxID=544712 RepID=C6HI90_AJECH|nr:predicted protein [Histoplasma capsulatum H143]